MFECVREKLLLRVSALFTSKEISITWMLIFHCLAALAFELDASDPRPC